MRKYGELVGQATHRGTDGKLYKYVNGRLFVLRRHKSFYVSMYSWVFPSENEVPECSL